MIASAKSFPAVFARKTIFAFITSIMALVTDEISWIFEWKLRIGIICIGSEIESVPTVVTNLSIFHFKTCIFTLSAKMVGRVVKWEQIVVVVI